MGCCSQSRQIEESSKSVEDQVIEFLEIKKIDLRSFESIYFHHKSETITEHNFKEILDTFGYDYLKKIEFFKYFIVSNNSDKHKTLSFKKIYTLVIALCDSDIPVKCNKLFHNYHNGKTSLDIHDVKNVIEDMLFIHLYAIPSYALTIEQISQDKIQFLRKIIGFREKMKGIFLSYVFSDFIGNEINLSEFRTKIANKDAKNLLNGNTLRQITFKLSSADDGEILAEKRESPVLKRTCAKELSDKSLKRVSHKK